MDGKSSEQSKSGEGIKHTLTSRSNGAESKGLNTLIIVLGILFLLVATTYVALQIARWQRIPQNLALTYVGLGIIPLGLAFFLRGGFPSWVTKRRTVERAELNGLYSEIERYGELGDGEKDEFRNKALEQAKREKKKLESLGRPVFELDALPLRQVLVDLYHPESELISKARGELQYIEEYAVVEDSDRVYEIIEELEKNVGKEAGKVDEERKREELVRRLRADLKSLCDTTAWYDRTWAKGEWIHICVTCWVAVTVLVTMFIGILPIIHTQGDWNLCVGHWSVLGAAGGLLSILVRLHRLDISELGETEGKQLVQGTIRTIAIGGLTAVLLYGAIWGEVLAGKVFPDLPTGHGYYEVGTTGINAGVEKEATNNEYSNVSLNSLRNVGLSLFWALFAGISPMVLPKLSQLAERSLGEIRGDQKGD